jgi:hypothetical protein
MTWNLQDNSDKATRASQRARREKLYRAISNGIEIIYDRLDSGESIEGIAIDVDISAAGGALSQASHKFWRGALEAIRVDRERGVGRNEAMRRLRKKMLSFVRKHGAGRDGVIAYARKSAKALCKIPQAEQLLFGFAERKP